MDITEFLLTRIAEDEAAAQAAIQGHADDGVWTAGDNNGEQEGYPGDCAVEGIGIKIYDEGGHDLDQAKHIARWDPRRVLAECAAKRAIIEAQHWAPKSGPSDSELHCRASHPSYEYATTEGPRKQWDDADEPPEGVGWERNTDIGYGQGWARLDYTEESYWRRLRPEPERKEWKQHIPTSLRALATVYSDHCDYQQEWSL